MKADSAPVMQGRLDRSRWRLCSPLWWSSSRYRTHHYHDFGCPLGVCMPGRARADCTRHYGITSHGVVRGWKNRTHGTNRCSYLPEPVEPCAPIPVPTKPSAKAVRQKARVVRRRRRFDHVDLHNWAFAIMVALLFISCGLGAVVDVYERLQAVPEKSN